MGRFGFITWLDRGQTILIAIGAASATVVGAAGWLCDAMATAVMVGGADSAKWFGQPELQGYQVFAVNRHDATAWEI
jgi:thiamine biosynthesis lipoprotein